jgi:hypothetical protein
MGTRSVPSIHASYARIYEVYHHQHLLPVRGMPTLAWQAQPNVTDKLNSLAPGTAPLWVHVHVPQRPHVSPPQPRTLRQGDGKLGQTLDNCTFPPPSHLRHSLLLPLNFTANTREPDGRDCRQSGRSGLKWRPMAFVLVGTGHRHPAFHHRMIPTQVFSSSPFRVFISVSLAASHLPP